MESGPRGLLGRLDSLMLDFHIGPGEIAQYLLYAPVCELPVRAFIEVLNRDSVHTHSGPIRLHVSSRLEIGDMAVTARFSSVSRLSSASAYTICLPRRSVVTNPQ